MCFSFRRGRRSRLKKKNVYVYYCNLLQVLEGTNINSFLLTHLEDKDLPPSISATHIPIGTHTYSLDLRYLTGLNRFHSPKSIIHHLPMDIRPNSKAPASTLMWHCSIPPQKNKGCSCVTLSGRRCKHRAWVFAQVELMVKCLIYSPMTFWSIKTVLPRLRSYNSRLFNEYRRNSW